MSDVKKFTGFIAIDGSTHTSQKAAVEHSRQVKVQTALKEKFGTCDVLENNRPFHEQEGQEVNLADFIYANRESILAALNQEVLTRKKRTPKAKPAVAANDTPVAAAA